MNRRDLGLGAAAAALASVLSGRALALFEYDYMVPLLSPEAAAYLATATELACPVLLAAGLAALRLWGDSDGS